MRRRAATLVTGLLAGWPVSAAVRRWCWLSAGARQFGVGVVDLLLAEGFADLVVLGDGFGVEPPRVVGVPRAR